MKKLLVVGLIIFCVLPFAACGTFEGFDDDGTVAGHQDWSASLSAESTIGTLYTFASSNCNGVKHIRSIDVPQNPKFRMTIDVESGRFKIVLIKDDLVYVIGSSEEEQTLEEDIPADTYALCMVAQDAQVKLFQFWFNGYQ